MSSHYANLEWAANDRRVDLPKLKDRTEDRLQQAKSDAEARRAFESFLRAFGDAHLEIDWRDAGKSSRSDASLCDRLGYDQTDRNGGIDWSVFPGYTPVEDADSGDFPGGILRLSGSRNVAVVRIGLFSEHAHSALCKEAQHKFGYADNAKCDDACADDFELAVSNLLTAALERRVQSLRRAGATSLLIDITGNGGGTNWVEPAARVLTPVPLKSPRIGFVRHEHWARDFRERLREVESDLPQAPDADRQALTSAAETLRAALAQTTRVCDRSVLWVSPPSSLHCSQLVTDLVYTSGVLPYAKPGAFGDLRSKPVLFYPSRYEYHEGANTLPLTVLVDGNTASSAEYFAAMLQDNKAATIMGQLTVGAGCGFTNGGIPTVLRNSGARTRLSDCARIRADGSDEVAGVTPDILLPWADRDSRYQHAMKLKQFLEKSQRIFTPAARTPTGATR